MWIPLCRQRRPFLFLSLSRPASPPERRPRCPPLPIHQGALNRRPSLHKAELCGMKSAGGGNMKGHTRPFKLSPRQGASPRHPPAARWRCTRPAGRRWTRSQERRPTRRRQVLKTRDEPAQGMPARQSHGKGPQLIALYRRGRGADVGRSSRTAPGPPACFLGGGIRSGRHHCRRLRRRLRARPTDLSTAGRPEDGNPPTIFDAPYSRRNEDRKWKQGGCRQRFAAAPQPPRRPMRTGRSGRQGRQAAARPQQFAQSSARPGNDSWICSPRSCTRSAGEERPRPYTRPYTMHKS